jgi:hypothetical protein
MNVLQGNVNAWRFRDQVEQFGYAHTIDEGLAKAFHRAIERQIEQERRSGVSDLRARFDYLCTRYARADSRVSAEDKQERRRLVGELRSILAAACVQELEPDLIILDEFQRFRHLLAGEDDAALLAKRLFEYSDDDSHARVLLLSATPYKMYTIAGDEDDHYSDFLNTLRFLEQNPATNGRFDELLQSYRTHLFRLGDGAQPELQGVQRELEQCFRKVMSRTERLAVSADRNGMLTEIQGNKVRLDASDLRCYLGLQQIADIVDHADPIEYWKSSPYLLSFMEGYQFKRKLRSAAHDPAAKQAIVDTLAQGNGLGLSGQDLERYAEIDPANARLRWLIEDVMDSGSWQFLWVPPCHPYYRPSGPFSTERARTFTKRLIFSAWRVVPKMIAAILSYEAERRMIGSFERKPLNTQRARERRRPLLRFSLDDGRPSGMPVLGLLYPSTALARLLDPLAYHDGPPTIEEAVEDARRKLRPSLEQLVSVADAGEPPDERWYWAAPILLDLQLDPDSTREWWNREDLPDAWSEADEADDASSEHGGFREHVERARLVATARRGLGSPPEDLELVLAHLALAGPGVTALRALGRIADGTAAYRRQEVRDAAARVAWSFRSLFNHAEAIALIRGQNAAEPYWRRVLEYCLEGNLQSVLDEYVHVLRDARGLSGRSDDDAINDVATAVGDTLALRTVNLGADDVRIDDHSGNVVFDDRRMRARFALRFGDEKDEDTSSGTTRSEQVRAAFNSPFWPFVLATTSVGQEGLDFHTYCHAVVHWNLPSNPVDLEQREGRVHRFKGHAVRKNVAQAVARRSDFSQFTDPWDAIFSTAVAERDASDSDLNPFWVHPIEGGARIERHVPALPLSRDVSRMEALRRSLAIYRMVFGQPRQEDLVGYLLEHLAPEDVERYMGNLRIDLAPQVTSR